MIVFPVWSFISYEEFGSREIAENWGPGQFPVTTREGIMVNLLSDK